MANARKIALECLLDVRNGGAYSNLTLNKYLSDMQISSVDKSFVTAIFYGVLDRTITLDYVLSKYIKTPLNKVSPMALECLRIALYQIMYMDKVPESAAVNETVKIIKNSKEKYLSGFVNGVLRNILRNGINLPSGDDITSLSIRYSCPEWITESFVADYGIENAKELLKFSLVTPSVTLRVNTLNCNEDDLIAKLLNEGIKTEKTFLDNALKTVGGFSISDNSCYRKGLFHVQDTASQTVVKILSPQNNERILDLCAAPGGKSFTMAEYMQNMGEIVSCDIYANRVKLIDAGAKRLGIIIIKPTVNDATVFNKDLGEFDAILCDVPCSGLGVIGRKPEIKYKDMTEYDDITVIQSKILENADLYLKTGGRIIYSTCTLRKCENDDIIQGFLDKHPHYELKYQHTFMPHIDGTDGFYCALLQKSR